MPIQNIDVLCDDNLVDITLEANFIWSIANKLRGVYMPDKYGDVKFLWQLSDVWNVLWSHMKIIWINVCYRYRYQWLITGEVDYEKIYSIILKYQR